MAESFTIEWLSFGEATFSLLGGPHRHVPIPMKIAKGLPADAWDQVHSSPLFAEWTSYFCNEGRMRLESVLIQKVKPEIHLIVEATCNGTKISGPVVLRPMQTSVLLVLRNSHTHLELCVFVKRPDLTTGLTESLGLVEGTFDADGKFTGPCAALLEEHMQLSFHRDHVVDLARATHGTGLGQAGMLFSPSVEAPDGTEAFCSPVRTELLLYRCNALPEELSQLEQKLGRTKRHGYTLGTFGSLRQSPELGLCVVYMGDTWRATLDPRAMAALFLLVESRYHQVKLPKPTCEPLQGGGTKGQLKPDGGTSAPRREAGPMPNKKATAQFCKISSLDPQCTGVNLRVKVVEPIKREPDFVLPRGQVVRRGTMVVGDEDAIITVNLEGSQLDLPDVVNTPLLIRNGQIKMEDGHMRLIVDRWGKISDASGEDFSNFNFSVCTVMDVSATEYELVALPENEQDPYDSSAYSYAAGGRPVTGRKSAIRGTRRRVLTGQPLTKSR